jgi:hypothetical protein
MNATTKKTRTIKRHRRTRTAYVVCITWQGETYRSAPIANRAAAEAAAVDAAPAWVETVQVSA